MTDQSNSLPGYFDVTYVINLKERTDRRAAVEKEFEKLGWTEFQFFPAIKFDDAGGFKSTGWRGCFSSHLECLREARRHNFKNVLIFEDDITLSSSVPRLTPGIIATLRNLDWDILYFGHENTGQIPRATRNTVSFALERCDIEFPTAHFYAVNQGIMPRLIAHFERLEKGTPGDNDFGPMPPDGALNTFRRHNKDVMTYIVNPKLGWQRPSRSDLSPSRLDGITVLRPFISIARNIKHFLSRD